MGIRTTVATAFSIAGAAALAVGMYGMEATGGSCTIDGNCPVPPSVMIPCFVGGMITVIVATVAGAGAVGFGLAFLAPGVGSIAAIATGYGTAVGYIFGVVFTLVGGGALVLGSLAGRGRKAAEELRATGHPGTATVLSVRDTGVSVNDNPRVRLRLQVHPADGSGDFEAELAVLVSRVSIPRAGDRYQVVYDPADRERLVLGDVQAGGGSFAAQPTMPAFPPPPAYPQPAEASGRPAPAWGTPDAAGQTPADRPLPVETVVDQLTKLDALRRSGALTEEEFQQQKARLLAQ
ncbi:MAG TPA: SHOCT domain-containing protein [Kineosporiaceae bacterium]|nr:SHOCT domain-containing protein [Kineosporiaceae bacterium]